MWSIPKIYGKFLMAFAMKWGGGQWAAETAVNRMPQNDAEQYPSCYGEGS